MKSLFQSETISEIQQRIDNLQPNTARLWGKMEVAQMLAHCSAALEVAVGEKYPPRMFIGRILGPFLKPIFFNDKPLKRNTPTDKSFLIIDNRNFEREKTRLMTLIRQFHTGGPQKVTTHPHSFFGKLTSEEWSVGMYKHLDHHLRQFGV
jgi:hypothetical protein